MIITTQREWRAKWNELWSRDDLRSVTIAVAYCSRNGAFQVETSWNKRQPQVRLLVGLNDGVTDIFAREALCKWQDLGRGKVEVKGEFQSSGRFHPKIYVFDCGEETHTLIGSVNLTKSAFYENTEASIELVGPSDSPEIREVRDAIEHWWERALPLSLEGDAPEPLSVEARLLETMRNGALVDIEATLSPARGHFKDDIFELGAELYQEEGAFSVERLRKTEVMLLGQKTHKELEKRRDQAHENCRNFSFTISRGHFVPITAFTHWKTRHTEMDDEFRQLLEPFSDATKLPEKSREFANELPEQIKGLWKKLHGKRPISEETLGEIIRLSLEQFEHRAPEFIDTVRLRLALSPHPLPTMLNYARANNPMEIELHRSAQGTREDDLREWMQTLILTTRKPISLTLHQLIQGKKTAKSQTKIRVLLCDYLRRMNFYEDGFCSLLVENLGSLKRTPEAFKSLLQTAEMQKEAAENWSRPQIKFNQVLREFVEFANWQE